MYDIRTMEERVAASIAEARAIALLLLVTAALATLLAAVAVYGSIWYAVTQRIPEIGIRLALGASRPSICRQVIGGALGLTAAGTAIGAAAALATGPLLRGLLFDTPPADPATYAWVILCLMVLTAAASVLPARRAMSVDPLIALRSE
jgi:ABC-type antimicrobial peptide transport system permease subunit